MINYDADLKYELFIQEHCISELNMKDIRENQLESYDKENNYLNITYLDKLKLR
jgi:hypothetical protein